MRIINILSMVVMTVAPTLVFASDAFDCSAYRLQVMQNPVATQQALNNLSAPTKGNSRVCFYTILAHAQLSTGNNQAAENSLQLGVDSLNTNISPALAAELNIRRAEYFINTGQGDKGKTLILSAIQQARECKDQEVLAEALFISGLLHNATRATPTAIAHLQEAYDLTNASPGRVSSAQIAFAIGNVLMTTVDQEKALKYFDEALAFAQENNITQAITFTLQHKTEVLLSLNRLDEAVSSIQQTIENSVAIDDFDSVSTAYSQLAEVEIMREQYQNANELLLTALDYRADKLAASFENLPLYYKLAQVAFYLSRFKDSQSYLDKAREGLTSDTSQLITRDRINKLQAYLHAENGDHKSAFELYSALELDIIAAQERDQNNLMLELQSGYEANLHEKENQQLRQQNLLQEDIIAKSETLDTLYLLSILLLTFALILLAIFAYKTREHRLELTQIINRDTLTKVLSRRRIMQVLGESLDNSQEEVSIALLDLDHFKRVNDTYGHSIGDKVLREFGALANTFFADIASVGRIGGEEFLVVFTAQHAENAEHHLNNFMPTVHAIAKKVNITVATTTSIGVCHATHTRTLSKLLSLADSVLYQAKAEGRDCIRVHAKE